MAASRNYSSTATATTLAGAINNSATSFTVGSVSGFPLPPFGAVIDRDRATEEAVLVTAVVGTTVTATRGFDSTSAVSHDAGATFEHALLAVDLKDAAEHVGATTGVHGVTGALVGVTDTQTLTNKTLTAPAINTATISGGTVDVSTLRKSGVDAALVSGTQTLTGKTLTSPTIDNPTLTGGTVNPTTLQQGGVQAVTTTGTQTLTNKTLTSPTVNSGALSGTLSGSPTFSGNPVFSGVPVIDEASGTTRGGPFYIWETYSPTLSSESGATPTIGTGGTRNGRWTKAGRTVTVSVELVFGSGATQPGQSFLVSLPHQVSTGGIPYVGTAVWTGSGAAPNMAVGAVIAFDSLSVATFRFPSTSTTGDYNSLTNGVFPLPFSSGDSLRFTITYESNS